MIEQWSFHLPVALVLGTLLVARLHSQYFTKLDRRDHHRSSPQVGLQYVEDETKRQRKDDDDDDDPTIVPQCEDVPRLVANSSTPFEVNDLRRILYLSDPDCAQRHLRLLARTYLKKYRRNKHLNLHIPRSGGTSLCRLVQNDPRWTTVGGNCWVGEFCPVWCGCRNREPLTCDALSRRKGASFVMNENWLDPGKYCPDRMYSIVMREPTSRSVSHVQLFLDAVASRGHEHFGDTKGWRLNLIQSNYVVCSLVAGSRAGDPRTYRPVREDLPDAKTALRRMDAILDIAGGNEECTALSLRALGFAWKGEKGLKSKARWDPNENEAGYGKNYDLGVYDAMNALDAELYAYAKRIIRADCDFFNYTMSLNN